MRPRRARSIRGLVAVPAGALLLLQAAGSLAQIRSISPGMPAPSAVRMPAVSPAATPAIVSVRPPGCIAPGATLYIQARNFSAGEGLAIGGNGAHVDLQIGPDMASVVAVVPAGAALAPGAGYVLGIEKADHSAWLSNLQNVTICSASAGTPAPTPASAESPASATSAESPASAAAPAAVPLGAGLSSGGSLLGEPIPPPPADQQSAASVKEDVTVEPGEVVVVSASMQDAQQVQQQAQAFGMSIKRRSALGHLGLVVSVFRVPPQLGVASALAQLRKAMPEVRFDANHRYRLEAGAEVSYGAKLVGWPASQDCTAGMKIGLIDTAIDLQHPAFRSRAVIAKSFLASGVAPAPADHGTAVASLLVGDGGVGLMPGAELRAAAVFRSRGKNEIDTTAELVARALDWLVGEKVALINLSFGGERNQLLETAIMRVEKLGIPVLAAAGNGGPDAPPVYPAAQPGVIAVTALDAKLEPYRYANHGSYIAYAAPGVDVWAAASGGKSRYVSGTSYAVPFATAVFAEAKAAQPRAGWGTIDETLRSAAKDLGPAGRDDTFGWGLIRAVDGCGKAPRRSGPG